MKETVAILALGCPKALIDAEQIMASLAQNGYQISLNDEDCDILFVNTCSFVEEARKESFHAINKALKLKKTGKIKKVIVTGCLPQMFGEELKKKYPGVDAFLGTGKNEFAIKAAKGEIYFDKARCDELQGKILPRLQLTLQHVAYLRIAEGCSHNCSFCTIPSIRGPFHSFPLKEIIKEAEAMANLGVKELILIAQDTSIVGLDADPAYTLRDLTKALEKIDGIKWVRIMYTNPMHLTETVLEAFAVPKVLPYFDIPFQHINDTVLQGMGRPHPNSKEIEMRIKKLRGMFKDAVLRTTFIVGFPGEGKLAFDELLSFTKETRFDRLGVFNYSPEPGTQSYSMKPVPKDIALKRRNEILDLQAKISEDRNTKLLGQTIPAIIDSVGRGGAVGRTMADAPEIDGTITIRGFGLKVGQIVNVRINSHSAYDLGGVKVAS